MEVCLASVATLRSGLSSWPQQDDFSALHDLWEGSLPGRQPTSGASVMK
jgi:hypothetical protein